MKNKDKNGIKKIEDMVLKKSKIKIPYIRLNFRIVRQSDARWCGKTVNKIIIYLLPDFLKKIVWNFWKKIKIPYIRLNFRIVRQSDARWCGKTVNKIIIYLLPDFLKKIVWNFWKRRSYLENPEEVYRCKP